ncbi:hypothetical protein BD324DRAFT_636833 [Kockovaella imperatae]|uniref:Uncharacterized protein n=1 Tax=Kockovaella imperatae TaxID=4999 RepID=A0A1Y1U805_9TREE|nr:hypothetical protein BD324DRAFT_636833 [Kockovaella imperatae]ORX34142.1 hypothetical protein BD324DRAFT_636833 [Kockovaella imperatae]
MLSITSAPLLVSLIASVSASPIGEVQKRCSPDGEITLASTSNPVAGDGNPHQNYYHEQISDTVTCASGDCSVSVSDTVTLSYHSDVSLNNWISGGFDVAQSFSMGSDYACNAGANDEVCVWISFGTTAYTVGSRDTCGNIYDVGVLQSPNKNGQGSTFYCVTGKDCRTKGQGYWEGGCAGGPQGNCGNGQVLGS